MGTPETSREPCPDRILDDIGGAFGMGAVGGSLFHFIKGSYSSPRGERLFGGAQAAGMNAPRIGGSFAVWGGLFSAFDCTAVYLRQKEDPWNSIFAGAATGGFLQMRQGMRSAGRAAVFGGILLAMIEGAGIMLNKIMSQQQQQQMQMQIQQMQAQGMLMDPNGPPPNVLHNIPGNVSVNVPPQTIGADSRVSSETAADSESSGSWFGGWFGKREEKQTQQPAKPLEVVFESDTPVPSFEMK